LNIDEQLLEGLITPRTRAIVVVHYAGVGCRMETILDIANQHGIAVIEDNAHGLFGRYNGQLLGTFGCLATQSFHETKNLYCGEGGALVINKQSFVERAEILREKGTNRSAFFRGQVDKYTWVDAGSSYVISDCLAAFLYAQLEQRERIQSARAGVWRRYADGLRTWALEQSAGLPQVPAWCQQSFHMFYVLMPTLESRQALIEHLKSRGILSVFHYVPLHCSPMGMRYGGQPGDCPVTESISDRLLRLPFYNDLSEEVQSEVIGAVREFSVTPRVYTTVQLDLGRLARSVAGLEPAEAAPPAPVCADPAESRIPSPAHS